MCNTGVETGKICGGNYYYVETWKPIQKTYFGHLFFLKKI
jgi:hypothetical protein